MQFEKKGSEHGERSRPGSRDAQGVPGRTTAVAQLQYSASAASPQAAAAPAPAYNHDAGFKDKDPQDIPAGVLNQSSTLDWDKSAKLYGIDGPASASLRGVYEQHLRGQLAGEPLMRELGAQALLPGEIGARIDRIAEGTEPLFVGAVEKTGPAAAQPYRQVLWRCSQRAIIATLSTSKSIRYQKTTGTTYCNVYSSDMVNAMGGYLPRVWYVGDLETPKKAPKAELEKRFKVELSANLIGTWLVKWGTDFGWKQEADAAKAQAAANAGRVVIIQASKANPASSGHVNVIIAEGNGHAAQSGATGLQPLQSQAGDSNYEYSDTAPKTNSDNWWKPPEDGGPKGDDAMQKEPGGNFWIYTGPHRPTAVAGATEMGKLSS